MTEPISDFPLADALRDIIAPQIDDLVNGAGPELLAEVTPTTAELLRWWFQYDYCDNRRVNFHDGQRAAVLHTIYAQEVLRAPRLFDLYGKLAPTALLDGDRLGEVLQERHSHPKYAAKMATGTGKTWVLNALLVWQYLNHRADPGDPRFTSNFLVVAPGLIVYDRLLDSFCGPADKGDRDFSGSDLYRNQDLFIPDIHRSTMLGFAQSSVMAKHDIGRKVTGGGMIAITNWHLLSGAEDEDFVPEDETDDTEVGIKEAVHRMLPLSPGVAQGNALETLDRRFARGIPLQSLIDLPDLMVFNDEAHHVHTVRKRGVAEEVEWQASLNAIAATKGNRFIQVDFSATPYDELRGRRVHFPHIVVDFDLPAAMRRGLVKALAIDRRREIAALRDLDYSAVRENGRAVALSEGQRVMLRAGLTKLNILAEQFAQTDQFNRPKMLVMCEDTTVTPLVQEFLQGEGLAEADVLRIDSGKKAELTSRQWEPIKERLSSLDDNPQPRVVVSVLMLREGFDVNNICVIVPLRAAGADILAEQTVGRGMRLMWRGDEAIDELKKDTRERIAGGLEPANYFDVLFVVEHPKFVHLYTQWMNDGLAAQIGDDADAQPATGDHEVVGLREGFDRFDFDVPVIVREAAEELTEPVIDPAALAPSSIPLDPLLASIGKGDVFSSEDYQTGTRYGDYRVDGGVMTATGYNDYLARITTRISEAVGRTFTPSATKYQSMTEYPVLQIHQPQLAGWIDGYIRARLFRRDFDPFDGENWRVLLLEEVAQHIAGVFTTKLVEMQDIEFTSPAEVLHRKTSDVKAISVRSSTAVDVGKCIYPRLPIPSRAGGLERRFILWSNRDTSVEAFVKLHEFRHDFLRRPYLKADGMPALYSPDFLVRTKDAIFVVETKGQGALSDVNVQRKKRAALAWCDRINDLPASDRADRLWYYVLLGQQAVESWEARQASVADLLDYARLRPEDGPRQEQLPIG